MSAVAAQSMEVEQRPVIMFIDDEERVLKSMRAMFRKDYEVHLANSGAEALSLLEQHDIDVVVSDQRMPEMTGVEVLTEIKQRSPRTIRILLTGYADLEAVEASINDAEVFKYLMKPCPADEVRGAVKAGLDMRGGGEPIAAAVTVTEAFTEEDVETTGETEAVVDLPVRPVEEIAYGVQICVLSADSALYDGVAKACTGQKLHRASTQDEALQVIADNPVGVLVTDIGVDEREISELTRSVRRIVPEMVVILASDRSDATVLIQLINSGQVFRFLLKPLQVGQCKIWLTSALKRFAETGADSLADIQVEQEPSAWARFKKWFLGD